MSEPRQITDSATNPLLKAWVTPFATPPFDEIKPEHFLPAFEQAFADHAAEIAAIANDPAAADFANTITAQADVRQFCSQPKKILAKQSQNAYVRTCPISHVPVVVCQSVGIRTRGRTAAKGRRSRGALRRRRSR